jgi:hypothetical protein
MAPVRILFDLPFPGYVRMYGSTIRLLAERGHRVLLCYADPKKRRDSLSPVIETLANVEVVPPLPAASRRRESAIEQLRAVADYLRYVDARYAGAPYLRRRLEKYLEGRTQMLTRLPYGSRLARAGLRLALALERLVPSDKGVERALTELAPDAIVVIPLVGRSQRNRRQTDTVKAAHRLSIPVGAGVPTWDHLTTKGVVKAVPDRLFVWNEIMQREAAELHFVPPERVVVTGAQLFDGWFDRTPSTTREEFLRRLGLPSGEYVVFLGSSPNISPPDQEIEFVRRWIEALRGSPDPGVAKLGILVRPHPYNVEAWAGVDLGQLGAAVAPRRQPEVPMSPQEEALYFDSVHFSSAVVGINTSAMVEAFIQRKPVLSIRAPEFQETQSGTLHFQGLAGAAGGALQTATTLEQHCEQLGAALARPGEVAAGIEAFLRTFVRPRGLDRAATPILADEIEALARRNGG